MVEFVARRFKKTAWNNDEGISNRPEQLNRLSDEACQAEFLGLLGVADFHGKNQRLLLPPLDLSELA